MRAKTMCAVGVTLALAGVTITAQPAAQDKAATVLAAAREALGGEKKLSVVKTIVATGRTRQVRGDNLVPIEFEIAIELPDKYVRKDEIPAQESDPSTVGFNGADLIQFPVPTLPTMPARAGGPPSPTAATLEAARVARLNNVRQDFARLTLGLFASSFGSVPLTFTYVGVAEAPQGKADVLDVKGTPNVSSFSGRLFINAETHLPIMIAWTPPAPPQRGMPGGGGPADGRGTVARGDGPPPAAPSRSDSPAAAAGQAPPSAGQRPGGPGQPPQETRLYFAEYHDANGLQWPFRLRRAVGADTVEEMTFDGFKINGKIDPKKFAVRQ
jgi:hypothetical protein